jgi:hypothetical protein
MLNEFQITIPLSFIFLIRVHTVPYSHFWRVAKKVIKAHCKLDISLTSNAYIYFYSKFDFITLEKSINIFLKISYSYEHVSRTNLRYSIHLYGVWAPKLFNCSCFYWLPPPPFKVQLFSCSKNLFPDLPLGANFLRKLLGFSLLLFVLKQFLIIETRKEIGCKGRWDEIRLG